MATPCNTINAQFIKTSDLSYYTSFQNNDLIYIIQSGSGTTKTSKYSKLSDLLEYISTGSFTGSFTGTFEGDLNGTFVGNATASLMGDIYSPTGELVLDNGTGVANTSVFYGSSSFATHSNTSETASYALNSDAHISSSHSLNSDASISASHSLFSDASISASYSESSSFSQRSSESVSSVTSSYSEFVILNNCIADGFPYITDTLQNILNPSVNTNVIYRYDHGLSAVPSLVKVTLYVSETWTNSSGNVPYILGDELDTNSLIVDYGADNDGSPIWISKDSTSIYIGYSNRASYTIQTSAGIYKFVKPSSNNTSQNITGTGYVSGVNIEWDKLKYKIYIWK